MRIQVESTIDNLITSFQKRRLRDKNPLSRGGYSLTGLFRHIRRRPSVSFFGDYIILSRMVKNQKDQPRNFKRKLRLVIKQSNELSKLSNREKVSIMDNLL